MTMNLMIVVMDKTFQRTLILIFMVTDQRVPRVVSLESKDQKARVDSILRVFIVMTMTIIIFLIHIRSVYHISERVRNMIITTISMIA